MAGDPRWWTHCTSANNVIGFNQYLSAALWTGPWAAATAIITAAAGEPWCLLIAAELSAIVWVLIYCEWWLNQRLVCLGSGAPRDGETVSAVGMVINVEEPKDKSFPGNLDSDYSVNLLLPPNEEGVDRATAVASAPYGYLIAETDITRSQGLMAPANQATDEATGKASEALHVEFEGAGIHDLQLVYLVLFPVSFGALVLCLTGVGAVIAYILAILAFLAALLGLGLSPTDRGDPSDAGLPSLERNREDGKGATILAVTGRWVYDAGHLHDSFHSAQNEIHPILNAEIVGTWTGAWPADADATQRDYTRGYGEANDPATKDRQHQPEWSWKVHPCLDGCDPGDEPPPPR